MSDRIPARAGRFALTRGDTKTRVASTVGMARMKSEDRQDRAVLEQARADLAAGRLETVTLAQAKAELGD